MNDDETPKIPVPSVDVSPEFIKKLLNDEEAAWWKLLGMTIGELDNNTRTTCYSVLLNMEKRGFLKDHPIMEGVVEGFEQKKTSGINIAGRQYAHHLLGAPQWKWKWKLMLVPKDDQGGK